MDVRLNGWQRLWVAVAVIGLVPAVGMIAADWESADVWLRDIATAAPTRLEVAGVGEVEFPATMSREAIALVVGASRGNRDALIAGIRAWGVEFAKVLDMYATALNHALVIRVLGLWAAAVVLLYGGGLLAGWVWRGFRSPG